MWGSVHDGAVVAAARAADAMVRAASLTWPDVLSASLPAPTLSGCEVEAEIAIEARRAARLLLTIWERKFLDDLRHRTRYALTQRQRAALAAILAKVKQPRAAA